MTLLAGCGAEGTPAPHVPAPDAPASCPSTATALAGTTSLLAGPAYADARAIVGRVLGERGGIKVALQAAFAVLDDADGAMFNALRALPREDGLGSLGSHLVEVLHYVNGSGRYPQAHPAPLRALERMALTCDAAATWRAFGGLLALDTKVTSDGGVVLAAAGAGDRPWLTALVDAGRAALAEPELVDALERVELEDDDAPADGIRVGRPAFQALVHIVAANLAAPNFDPGFSRQLVDDALLALVTGPAARSATDRMLDVLFLPMDPSAAVFLDAQTFLGCVDDADDERALSGMLFDWLTDAELSTSAFVDDVAEQAGAAASVALRPLVVRLSNTLASRPSLAADAARVASSLFDDDHAPPLVRLAIDLKGRGFLAGTVAVLDELQTCRR